MSCHSVHPTLASGSGRVSNNSDSAPPHSSKHDLVGVLPTNGMHRFAHIGSSKGVHSCFSCLPQLLASARATMVDDARCTTTSYLAHSSTHVPPQWRVQHPTCSNLATIPDDTFTAKVLSKLVKAWFLAFVRHFRPVKAW